MENIFKSRKPIYELPENPTDEDIQKYVLLESLESERIKKEEEKLKNTQTPSYIREQYDYKLKLNMEDKDIPQFMKSVFIAPSIQTNQKDIFLEEICKPYFNETRMKDYLNNKYIYFREGILIDILEDESSIDPNDTGFPKLLIPINI